MNKRVLALMLSIVMLVATAFPVSAGTGYSSNWKQDASGKWFVQKSDGSIVKNCWFCDDSDPVRVKWYAIGADGFMVEAPLIQDRYGYFYSLETSHNGSYGMMRDKSGVYDGINIAINEVHNGAFGAITSPAVINSLSKKYGVAKIDIDNSCIVYAGKLANAVSRSGSSRGSTIVSVDITVPSEPGTYKYGAATLEVTATNVTYTNHTSTKQNVNLTSSGKNIIIDAPNDEITHRGSADSIIVKAVADSSYYGYATASSLEVNAGHVVLNANIDAVTVDAEKNVDIDISKDATVPAIGVDASEGKEVDLTVDGNVDTVTSSTGALTFTVGPTAPKVPKLEFEGDDAVAAYENRMKEKLKEKAEIPVYLTHNGETETYYCSTRYTEEWGTEITEAVIGGFGEGESRTFENDVIIDGDFGKIRFINCKFEGDIINRGNESTIVQFVVCSFSDSSECKLVNNGRKITIDDLVSKFMFMATDPINVICDSNSNGSVVSAETSKSIIYNGTPHSISDAQYFVDQRPSAYTTAIQEYEGQGTGIYYYGEFNSLEERKEINLSVYDLEATIYRAYIKINDDTIDDYDFKWTQIDEKKKQCQAEFTLASSSDLTPDDGIYTDTVLINSPYNVVVFDGCKFEETVTVKGLYTEIVFKNCDFNNKPVAYDDDGTKKTAKITYIDCTNVGDSEPQLLGAGIEEETDELDEVMVESEADVDDGADAKVEAEAESGVEPKGETEVEGGVDAGGENTIEKEIVIEAEVDTSTATEDEEIVEAVEEVEQIQP